MSRAGKTSKSRPKKAAAKTTTTKKAAAKGATAKPAVATKATAKKATATGKSMQLPAVLDLTAAAPLAKSLISRRGAELSVDASRVNRVGAQCLQVLVAASETWKTDGMRLRLLNPSPEFLEGSRLLGIHLDH
jgi:chemotaxis protein CheX